MILIFYQTRPHYGERVNLAVWCPQCDGSSALICRAITPILHGKKTASLYYLNVMLQELQSMPPSPSRETLQKWLDSTGLQIHSQEIPIGNLQMDTLEETIQVVHRMFWEQEGRVFCNGVYSPFLQAEQTDCGAIGDTLTRRWCGPCERTSEDDGPLSGHRWPYGPPNQHQDCCELFDGGVHCDCAASDSSDTEWGMGA